MIQKRWQSSSSYKRLFLSTRSLHHSHQQQGLDVSNMVLYNFQSARSHVESLLNYRFMKPYLLEEALHAGGPIYISGKYIAEGNKRLAMIGDSALDLALAVTDYQAGLPRGEQPA